MRIVKWISDNVLFIVTLFLLAFIPLYPKFPLIDLPNTWVYIRVEDLIVVAAVAVWALQVMRKKTTVRTPLTIPILIFWGIGGISLLYAIIFIFPTIANVFSNVALFHFLRRIEYLSVFFIAYSSIRDKKYFPYVVAVLSITLLAVVVYGLGQKSFTYEFQILGKTISLGWGQVFFAYSTMNEEFAKGIPLRLSEFARIPSTFAGHYDLAAYLVLLIPIMGSLVFGFKKWYAKVFFFFCAFTGLILLLLTASRVSFVVYLLTISFMLILQKQKKFIIPVLLVSVFLLNFFQGMSERFGSTISSVDVVVDARTGKPIGIAKKYAPKKRIAKQVGKAEEAEELSSQIVIEEIQSTGESLPQGSGFINLPEEPVYRTVTEVLYKRQKIRAGTTSAEITTVEGDFVIKKALAYDVSFTTRFQGTWPRAYEAFKRNMILGSGYSSINLATDSNYLRILGETGLLGMASFLLIFMVIGIYVGRILPYVESSSIKSFVLGVCAGIFGLGLNAILIDVFEASKVAFVLWFLVGISLGLLSLYQKSKLNYFREIINVLISTPAIIVYLFFATFALLSVTFQNYFVGDDFTWLRWVADCKKVLYKSGAIKCEPLLSTITGFFTDSKGFFYRPGAKLYYFVMYAVFWLNHVAYHVVSIFLHFSITSLTFLISQRILKSKLFALVVALFFLVLSSHSETILWISSTGHLFSSLFILLALLFYMYWKSTSSWFFFLASIISMVLAPLFQEIGIVAPFLVVAYDFITDTRMHLHSNITFNRFVRRWYYIPYLILIPIYFKVRAIAKSMWFSGDYKYNLNNLHYNIFGNLFGYAALAIMGSGVLPYYQAMRIYAREHRFITILAFIVFSILFFLAWKYLLKRYVIGNVRTVFVSISLFIIPLLPFLGLGNISIRYVYLASFGILLFMVFFMQKIYEQMVVRRRVFGIVFLVTIFFLFFLYQLRELYRVNAHWKKAGMISNNLLVSFNETFSKKRAYAQNPVFYFANVPIRYGDAWVFPVGLPDALWFTFQNEYLTVHVEKDLDLALDRAEGSASAKVFEFDKEGNAAEVVRTKRTFTVPVKKEK